jgi:3-keto-5-aminohexanoate cleavage enzyme
MNSDKIVVNFCPTGMIPTKEMTPHVPISPTEIIEQTHEAFELGITIVHLHARNEDGAPTFKRSVYQTIFEGVRQHCPDLIVCGSSSGRNWPEFEKRSEVIELRPDMCSLTLSSLNFMGGASVNSPETIVRLAEKMNAYGVVPELECFDLGMIQYGKYLIKKGILHGPFYWNLLFGNIAGFQPDLLHMATALSMIPEDHYASLAGLGLAQLPVNTTAIAMGYGVRIGIEDNIWWDSDKTKLASNTDLLVRLHHIMELQGKSLMKSAEFKALGFVNKAEH